MAQQKQEQDLNQLLKVRRDKLADLQANGKDPFQITKFNQTHHSMEVKSLYEAHEAELLKDRAEVDVTGLDEEQAKEAVKKDYEERREIMDASPIHVAIAGRMMFKRVMGKASFCNIQDLQGNIQVYVARDAIGADSYADFKKSDIGDIFGLEGFAFRTRTGEISIHAERFAFKRKYKGLNQFRQLKITIMTFLATSFRKAWQYSCLRMKSISSSSNVFIIIAGITIYFCMMPTAKGLRVSLLATNTTFCFGCSILIFSKASSQLSLSMVKHFRFMLEIVYTYNMAFVTRNRTATANHIISM